MYSHRSQRIPSRRMNILALPSANFLFQGFRAGRSSILTGLFSSPASHRGRERC